MLKSNRKTKKSKKNHFDLETSTLIVILIKAIFEFKASKSQNDDINIFT